MHTGTALVSPGEWTLLGPFRLAASPASLGPCLPLCVAGSGVGYFYVSSSPSTAQPVRASVSSSVTQWPSPPLLSGRQNEVVQSVAQHMLARGSDCSQAVPGRSLNLGHSHRAQSRVSLVHCVGGARTRATWDGHLTVDLWNLCLPVGALPFICVSQSSLLLAHNRCSFKASPSVCTCVTRPLWAPTGAVRPWGSYVTSPGLGFLI